MAGPGCGQASMLRLDSCTVVRMCVRRGVIHYCEKSWTNTWNSLISKEVSQKQMFLPYENLEKRQWDTVVCPKHMSLSFWDVSYCWEVRSEHFLRWGMFLTDTSLKFAETVLWLSNEQEVMFWLLMLWLLHLLRKLFLWKWKYLQ